MGMNREWTRRALMRDGLRAGALLGAGSLARLGGGAIPFVVGTEAVAGDGVTPSDTPPMLVVIFLRGGADGLHLLAPRSRSARRPSPDSCSIRPSRRSPR
jgi:uncharacterized protein (DUF1501 family)